MKNIILLLTIVCLTACNDVNSPTNTDLGKLLVGEHNLGKLPCKIDPALEQNVYFVLKGTELMFSWQLPDSSFIISSIPMNNVRMKFEPTIEHPFVKFRWRPQQHITSWDNAFKYDIEYIIVYCKESDFPLIPIN